MKEVAKRRPNNAHVLDSIPFSADLDDLEDSDSDLDKSPIDSGDAWYDHETRGNH